MPAHDQALGRWTRSRRQDGADVRTSTSRIPASTTRSRSSTRPPRQRIASSPRIRSRASADRNRGLLEGGDGSSASKPPGRARTALRALAWRLEHALGARRDVRGRAAPAAARRAAHGLLGRPGGLPLVGDAAPRRRVSTTSMARGQFGRLSAGLPVRPLADRQGLGDARLPAAEAARDPRRPRARVDRRHVRRAPRTPAR